jgi:ribulose 1,5-bisphosphate carboxylase large subunit-like protein
VAFYGVDTVFLIGGGLFRHSADITRGCRDLKEAVAEAAAARRLS